MMLTVTLLLYFETFFYKSIRIMKNIFEKIF